MMVTRKQIEDEAAFIKGLIDQSNGDSRNMRLGPDHPASLTADELLRMSNGHCPTCGHRGFKLGPRGGAAINVECGGCGCRYNVCNVGWSVLWGHRIPRD